MKNNPFIKPIALLVGVVVAIYVVGKFFAPKVAPPESSTSPIEAAIAKASPPDGPSAKLGPKAVKLPTGLQYEDLVTGTGAEAKTGSSIEVHYTGTLTTGMKFDSSRDRNEPYALTLPGQVIQGWNDGIPGMKVGGKRKLVVPPALGYGNEGSGAKIPPGATLVFEIELVKVK